MTKKPKADEKLGNSLKLPHQLILTPQLEHAIKILKLSLPELEAVVQDDLAQRGGRKKG